MDSAPNKPNDLNDANPCDQSKQEPLHNFHVGFFH